MFNVVSHCLVSIRTFSITNDISLLSDSKTSDQTRSTHVKWAVSLVIAHGHFDLPQQFLWVCMGEHHILSPESPLHSAVCAACAVFLRSWWRSAGTVAADEGVVADILAAYTAENAALVTGQSRLLAEIHTNQSINQSYPRNVTHEYIVMRNVTVGTSTLWKQGACVTFYQFASFGSYTTQGIENDLPVVDCWGTVAGHIAGTVLLSAG